MENIKIINKIGSGLLGDVYKCTIENNSYALKIEKIEKKNIEYDLAAQEWREIEFSQSFANNYPEQFVTLCCYDIAENNEKREISYNKAKLSKKVINRLTNKAKSTLAIRRLYSLVDDNLKNVIDTFTKKQLYSTIVQMAYICYLMQSHGYSHNDLHTKNIGVVYVDSNKDIKISNKKLCSHGIQIKALDFGVSMHEKYGLTETEYFMHRYGLINDINRFLIKLVTFEPGHLITKIFNWSDVPDVFDDFGLTREYKMLEDFAVNKYDKFYLFQLICPDKFQKMALKENFVKVVKPFVKIDLCDFLFIFKHKLDLKTIMKHFIKLSNE